MGLGGWGREGRWEVGCRMEGRGGEGMVGVVVDGDGDGDDGDGARGGGEGERGEGRGEGMWGDGG